VNSVSVFFRRGGWSPLIFLSRKHPRRTRFLVFFPVFLLASCGIETLPYIYPVDSGTTALTGGVLSFSHAADNGNIATRDYFKGYVLYYKLYTNDDSGKALLDEDTEAILASPVSPGPTRLTARGYLPMVTETGDLPHIGIDAEENAIPIEMFVTQPTLGNDQDLIATWTPAGSSSQSITFRRDSLDSDATTSTRTFDSAEEFWSTSGFEPDDYDVSRMIPQSVQTDLDHGILMVVFVLSYGINSTFQPFYSEPTLVYGEVPVTS